MHSIMLIQQSSSFLSLAAQREKSSLHHERLEHVQNLWFDEIFEKRGDFLWWPRKQGTHPVVCDPSFCEGLDELGEGWFKIGKERLQG